MEVVKIYPLAVLHQLRLWVCAAPSQNAGPNTCPILIVQCGSFSGGQLMVFSVVAGRRFA